MFGKKNKAIRDGLVGRKVMVNDHDGDGYHGWILKVDDSGYLLVGSGPNPVTHYPGDKGKPLEMGQAFIPDRQVKFVDIGG